VSRPLFAVSIKPRYPYCQNISVGAHDVGMRVQKSVYHVTLVSVVYVLVLHDIFVPAAPVPVYGNVFAPHIPPASMPVSSWFFIPSEQETVEGGDTSTVPPHNSAHGDNVPSELAHLKTPLFNVHESYPCVLQFIYHFTTEFQ